MAGGKESASKSDGAAKKKTGEEDADGELQLKPGEGVLIVQRRLPVRLFRNEDGDWLAEMDEDNLLASK